MTLLCIFLILLVIFLALGWGASSNSLIHKNQELEEYLEQLKITHKNICAKFSSLQSNQASITSRTGTVAEKLVPFLEACPFDPREMQFLGQPIDYIVFNEEKIVFIEVKTMKAHFSAKQKQIKKLVEAGKVEFMEIRL